MPTRDDDEEPRGRPLLKLLFWAGIGLAPIAMLLLLLADGNGPMRIAAVLAVLAVVLIGLSIGLRGDAEAIRGDLEDMVADEVDGLQNDVRRDIDTAARAVHRQIGEKIQTLQQTVDALRAQLDAQRAGPRPPSVGVPAQARDSGAAAGYGTAREGGTYGRAAEGATYGAGRGGVTYGADNGSAREPEDDRAANPQLAMAQVGRTYGAPADGSAAGTARPPRARMPGGVVRHTETVQVTTRHTVVDGGNGYGEGKRYRDDDRYRGEDERRQDERRQDDRRQDEGRYRDDDRYSEDERYDGYRASDWGDGANSGGGTYGGRRRQDDGGDYEGRADAYGGRRSRAAEDDRSWNADSGDDEESFTDRRLRELRGDRPAIERGDDPAYDQHWSSARAGDRWAAVRSDDRGRELRMGERRASVRSDDTGTEYRVEDRWAAVRREDDREAGAAEWYADAWSGSQSRSGSTYGSGGSTYGASRGNDDDEWNGGRALPSAERDRENSWGRESRDSRGGYDDGGGDARWR
ncbi:hypothetical protein [Asanoa iriomotensis]|uniref:Uncharacterized protein n=1 Tax=Asanoa iriomotensis TaxID=234613 RepID=A0ABQ4C2G3_9ACTN|nr:hypothetical protein [Asanoa iriomotensis]GIF56968.1 hypothetical protein Air01nite_30630 [Asanoa iriomotensis]